MNGDSAPPPKSVPIEARRRAADVLAQSGRTDEAVAQYLELVHEYVRRGRLSRAVSVVQALLALDDSRSATQIAVSALFAAPTESSTASLDELARTPIFAGLPREAFESVLATLGRRTVPEGEVIVREGERGDAMFVIVEGLVQIVRRSPIGFSRVVDEMGEGDFFGEMALVSHAPRLATVIAETECELLELDRARFESLTQAHPSIRNVAERFYKARLLSNLLRASPLFSLLPEDARARLVDVFALQSHPEGFVFLEMGKPGKGLFVLLRGECGVFHHRDDGSETAHPSMKEGDVFGELSLLHDGVATATVRALTPCVVLELRRECFDEVILSHPEVRERIYAIAGARSQRTRDLIALEAPEKHIV